MRQELHMPSLGYDMESGKIERWVKEIGDSVERGEAVAEIETDKATVEMESTVSGTLVEIVHAAGSDVEVGQVIAYVESNT